MQSRAGKATELFDKVYDRLGAASLLGFSVLVMTFLYLPVLILIIFSFNDDRSLTLPLTGFTLRWYASLFSNVDLLASIYNSFYVALIATSVTLLIGVPAAIALDRLDFPGKTVFRRLVLLPIALPGVITGVSMLNLFKLMGMNLSLETVILGHATGLVSIVVTQVFARLQRVNRSVEEVSADLGARPYQTFFLVTLPNIKTAIIGSALLSFTVSFDEIPVTFFLTGRDNTLPMYIWSTLRRGITPEINAVGTLIVISSLALIIVSVRMLRDTNNR
jgi:spermidine/putrescine transport system permease protein